MRERERERERGQREREKGEGEREGEGEGKKKINDQVASLSLLPLELLNMDENFSEKHQRFVIEMISC